MAVALMSSIVVPVFAWSNVTQSELVAADCEDIDASFLQRRSLSIVRGKVPAEHASNESSSMLEDAYLRVCRWFQNAGGIRKDIQRKGGSAGRLAGALFLPVLPLVLSFFLILWSLGLASQHRPEELVFRLCVFSAFQDSLSFCLPLLDSLRLAEALGAGSVFSGFVVGSYRAASVVGSLAMWMGLKHYPQLWRHARAILRNALFLQTLCAVVIYMSSRLPGVLPPVVLRVVLIAARTIQGVGGSLINILAVNLSGHLGNQTERPERMLTLNFAWTLGLGLAPLLAVSCNSLVEVVEGNVPGYEVTLYTGMFVPLLTLVLAFIPTLPETITSEDQAEMDATNAMRCGVDDRHTRVVVLSCCILVVPVRAFGTASLESGLSYILDVLHDWNMASVGVATSATFSSSFILKTAYSHCKEALTIKSWLRSWMLASLIGAIMLHPVFSSSPPILLVSCAVIFPTLYMSGGLLSGIMQNHCLPLGSILDMNTVILISDVSGNIIGRFLGPPAARWALSRGGLQAYWLQQMAVGILQLILVEVIVHFQLKTYTPDTLQTPVERRRVSKELAE